MARTGHTPTAAELSAGARRIEVMKLRAAGLDPASIAQQMGMTKRQVRIDLRKVVEQQRDEAGVWNAVLIEQLMAAYRAIHKDVIKGDLWAQDRFFQYVDRMVTLTGADKVASDSGAEIDAWLTGSVQATTDNEMDFEDMEDEILQVVVDEYDDLDPDDLDVDERTEIDQAPALKSRVRTRTRTS